MHAIKGAKRAEYHATTRKYVYVCMSMYICLCDSWISIFLMNHFIITLSKKKICKYYSLISVQILSLFIAVKFEKLAVKMHDGINYKHSYDDLKSFRLQLYDIKTTDV